MNTRDPLNRFRTCRWAALSALAACGIALATQPPSAAVRTAMVWAFPLTPASSSDPAEDMTRPLHVPGSSRTYRLQDYDDMFGAPDWWPQDHPPMPPIVARGRAPAWACAYCHLPNGQGRPENAGLAGLPADYIVEQVEAFRSGARGSAWLEMAKFMPAEARRVSDADLETAAEYFSHLHFKSRTRIIETPTVPKTQVARHMLVPVEGAGSEPIGERIIEVAQNAERFQLRDEHSGFIAYMPPGSTERGRVLATTGNGKTQACIACHGAGLRGVGIIPPLAGRSPTYIVRQLIQFQDGSRSGSATLPMRQVVATLTVDAMISVAAYAASRDP